jgi:hypothetical protein
MERAEAADERIWLKLFGRKEDAEYPESADIFLRCGAVS